MSDQGKYEPLLQADNSANGENSNEVDNHPLVSGEVQPAAEIIIQQPTPEPEPELAVCFSNDPNLDMADMNHANIDSTAEVDTSNIEETTDDTAPIIAAEEHTEQAEEKAESPIIDGTAELSSQANTDAAIVAHHDESTVPAEEAVLVVEATGDNVIICDDDGRVATDTGVCSRCKNSCNACYFGTQYCCTALLQLLYRCGQCACSCGRK